MELVVKAEYRGKGIGTMLMDRLEEYFKKHNCNIEGLGVLAPIKKAHRLYYKLGYEDRSFYMTRDIQDKKVRSASH